MDMMPGDASDAHGLLAESVAAFAAQNPGPARVRRVRETVPGFDVDVWRMVGRWLTVPAHLQQVAPLPACEA